MLMAGLDGIKNKIHPGEAADKDLYHLPPKELAKIPDRLRFAAKKRSMRWKRITSSC